MRLSGVLELSIVLKFSLAVAINSEKVYLGTVNEKSYYANSEPRDCVEARYFCESNGMNLATITSEEDASFLKSAFDPLNFNGWYWVGAYGNNTDIATFKWTTTGKNVEEFAGLVWMNETYTECEIQVESTCLCFAGNEDYTSYYFPLDCSQSHRTLCESSQPVEQEIAEKELTSLGTIDGKTFFGDGIMRSWNESLSLCETQGLRLANVSSWTQATFLKDATQNNIYKDEWFWVTAQFGRQVFPSWNGNGKVSLCPYFSPHNGLSFRRACINPYFTLCELSKEQILI